jgi:hypothetical protein
MTHPRDKLPPRHHSPVHPDAPAFHGGMGGFRARGVAGTAVGHDLSNLGVGAPAFRHAVWGRTPERPPPKKQPPVQTRLDLLAEAAGLLAQVKFGAAVHPTYWNVDEEWWSAGWYLPDGAKDREWTPIVKPGKSPADAVLNIFKTLDKWSFDCAQFVQVVLLYAIIKRVGKEAFDARVAAYKPTQGQLALRQHFTAGITYTGGSEHDKDELQTLNAARAAAARQEQERSFKAAPFGSQIVFTNLDPRSNGKAYEHENTIKMGDDQFIAHGIVKGSPFVSRDQIFNVLAADAMRGTLERPDDAYKKKYLYISQVVLYGDG